MCIGWGIRSTSNTGHARNSRPLPFYKDTTLAGLIREQTSKAVPWRCDLSRLRNTRAKSAPRSVCTALRGWRNCARERSNEHIPMVCRSHTRHEVSPRKSPYQRRKQLETTKSPDGSRWWCVRARYIVDTYIHIHVFTLTRNERWRSFEANAFLCHNLAARAKHPALACQPTCSPPLLGSNSRRSCSTAPNVPKARLYWFRSYENRAVIKDFVCF